MKSAEFRLNNIDATKRLARLLAEVLRPGDLVALSGDLGAGKTALTQAILANWNIAEVLSPTFTLLHSYYSVYTVHHLDLYRLDRVEEVLELGWDELNAGTAVVIVEWLDKFPELFPQNYLHLTLRYNEADDESRNLKCTASGKRGLQLLEEVARKW